MAAQLLCGQQAVLVGAGNRPAQIQVNHIKARLHPGAEVFHILPHIDGGGSGQHLPVIIGGKNLLSGDIHIVLVILLLQEDVEGIEVHIIPGLELISQVTGTVCAENHFTFLHFHTHPFLEIRETVIPHPAFSSKARASVPRKGKTPIRASRQTTPPGLPKRPAFPLSAAGPAPRPA